MESAKLDSGNRAVVGAAGALIARFRAEERLVLTCSCRSAGQDAPASHADMIALVICQRLGAATSA